jgi:nicotinamide-nucleotide amidase
MRIEKEIGKLLASKGLTISVAESCTGGLVQKLITDISGSSDYFVGGIVAYSNEAKQKLAGVKKSTLTKHGAVSGEVVRELAEGVRKLIGADIGISTTGIAGPTGGTSEKPVGLVYVGLSTKKRSIARQYLLTGTREQIRGQTGKKILELLKNVVYDFKDD